MNAPNPALIWIWLCKVITKDDIARTKKKNISMGDRSPSGGIEEVTADFPEAYTAKKIQKQKKWQKDRKEDNVHERWESDEENMRYQKRQTRIMLVTSPGTSWYKSRFILM